MDKSFFAKKVLNLILSVAHILYKTVFSHTLTQLDLALIIEEDVGTLEEKTQTDGHLSS